MTKIFTSKEGKPNITFEINREEGGLYRNKVKVKNYCVLVQLRKLFMSLNIGGRFSSVTIVKPYI